MKEIKEETPKELSWFELVMYASLFCFAAIAVIPATLLIIGILAFLAPIFIVLGIIVLIIDTIF